MWWLVWNLVKSSIGKRFSFMDVMFNLSAWPSFIHNKFQILCIQNAKSKTLSWEWFPSFSSNSRSTDISRRHHLELTQTITALYLFLLLLLTWKPRNKDKFPLYYEENPCYTGTSTQISRKILVSLFRGGSEAYIKKCTKIQAGIGQCRAGKQTCIPKSYISILTIKIVFQPQSGTFMPYIWRDNTKRKAFSCISYLVENTQCS